MAFPLCILPSSCAAQDYQDSRELQFYSLTLSLNGVSALPKHLKIKRVSQKQRGFPDDSADKESTYNAGGTGDTGLVPGSGRSPEVGNSNLLQFACLENSMDRSLAGYSPVQFSSLAQSCLTLYDPMDCSTPGLLVHQQLPKFTQTHVH